MYSLLNIVGDMISLLSRSDVAGRLEVFPLRSIGTCSLLVAQLLEGRNPDVKKSKGSFNGGMVD